MNMHQTVTSGNPSSDKGAVKKVATKVVNLALQGGGAHGAFTWGVLDRLLQDPRLDFEGVVATSAGAMNAAVMTYGLVEGGREGAQKALAKRGCLRVERRFWRLRARGGLR